MSDRYAEVIRFQRLHYCWPNLTAPADECGNLPDYEWPNLTRPAPGSNDDGVAITAALCLLIFLTVWLLSGCANLGDGRCFGEGCRTKTGQAIASATQTARHLLETDPEIRTAARLARRLYCTGSPTRGCNIIAAVNRINTVRQAVAKGTPVVDSEKVVAASLGGLAQSVQQALIAEVEAL